MDIEVELPDMGIEGGNEARLGEWYFDEGDYVEEGEILCEVVGDLESIEVPAPCSGTLIEQIVAEDEMVRIGEPIALIRSEDDEDDLEDDLPLTESDDFDDDDDDDDY